MTQYYDPWQHAVKIFVNRIFQFIALTIFLGFLTWYAWLHFYFEIEIWETTKQAVMGNAGLLKALLLMCFVSSGLITGWLFSWLIVSRKQKGDNHYRGSSIQNN